MEQESHGTKWEIWKFFPLPSRLHSPTLPLLLPMLLPWFIIKKNKTYFFLKENYLYVSIRISHICFCTPHMPSARICSVEIHTTDGSDRNAKVLQLNACKASYVKKILSSRSLFSTCLFSTPSALGVWQFGCAVVICSSNHKIVSMLIILSHHCALFWSLPFSLIFTEVSVLISNWKVLWSICAVWHILSRVTVHATIIKGSLVFLS